MSINGTNSPSGRPAGGTAALALLAKALPTGPSVSVVAVATGCAAAAFPSSAAGVGAVAITLLAITFIGVAVCLCEPASTGHADPGSSRPAGRLPHSSQQALILLVLAIAIGCTAPAFMHHTSASGALGELVTLVVAASILTFAVLELLHAAAAQLPAPPPSEAPARRPVEVVSEWSHRAVSLESLPTASLCREWKLSFLALRATSDALGRARVVDDRRRYLDELARRDPAGFQRWITDDPYPVAGHPENFIAGSPTPPPVSEV
ncbi:hypothetical protein LQ327_28530 [Actinomycetospora endophytica]|uniref:Uncharacterized protein n=1 Tax=Actinomycetospora endophytica TaxID=2291215 RepID=A0ABS8PGD4_9PSEU|nr:hypothetical protein [Actinomycetospora endophytica]MCD2197326.1 hypothetical protein [Actinomycetospora endophytica]